MKKVIGFRLALKTREVQRRAKKAKIDLAALGLDEPALEALVARASKATRPAVLFDTFPHPDAEQALLSPLPGLAYSLVLLSLGAGFDALEALTTGENGLWAPVWPLLRETGLDEARRFALGLLEEEAAKDSCELSPLNTLGEPQALTTALSKLDGSKIGVSCEGAVLAPKASEAFSVSWLSKSKAKKPKP